MTRLGAASYLEPVMQVVSYAVSDDAGQLRKCLREVCGHMEQAVSAARWRAVRKHLAEVAQECAEPGWDGYGARPVDPEAVLNATMALNFIPRSVRTPDVVPEPSGDIGLEWRDGQGSMFVMGFSGGNQIHFAGISCDGGKVYGSERFVAELSAKLLKHVVLFQNGHE